MKFIVAFIIISFYTTLSLAQTTLYKGKVIDSQTGKGVSDIHLYSEIDHTNGNITNTDGNFVIRLDKSKGVYFTHISYEPLYVNLEDSLKEVVITLKPNATTLKEIVVSTLSAEEIMKRAISSLEKNHEVEPVFYNFYTVITSFEEADSTVHTTEEYVGSIYQNNSSNTRYKLEKSRIGAFSKKGKANLKNTRMIAADKMKIDNIFKYKEDYLSKSKSKKYSFELIDEIEINQRPCYIIRFHTDEPTYQKDGELFIDVEDYAIVRKTAWNSEGQVRSKIDFVKDNQDGKWYLSNSLDIHALYKETSVNLRMTLYNRKATQDDSSEYRVWLPDFVVNVADSYEDNYWENVNYIPLPNWIEKISK